MKARIALVAEEAAGALALERCLASSHETVLLLSADRTNLGEPSRLRMLAKDHGIPAHDPGRVRTPDFAEVLRAHRVDLLLNVHSLFLIHRDVLSAPAFGAFNLHPGPLPEYAGINAVSWAIYERADEFGSTLHWLAEGIDTGAIAYATRFPLGAGMTAARLMGQSVREGLLLVDRLLEQLNRDPREIPTIPQDPSRRRYYGRSVPEGGRISWQRRAVEIDALVRACTYDPYSSPWGQPSASVEGIEMQITRTALTGVPSNAPAGTVGEATERGIVVSASDEWLEIQRAFVDGNTLSGPELGRQLMRERA